jgi:cytochrome c553
MKKGILAGMLGVAALVVGMSPIVAGLLAQSGTAKPAASPNAAKIARGKYLMTVGACNDCHSPKLDPQQHPDPKRPFSGRPQATQAPSQNPNEIHASLDLTAWSGPWGISYGANLSPDPETGLAKRYTEASFIKTLRTGKKPEGEDLLPPMPWELYKVFSDDDIKAIWAYLQTIPAIKNNVKSAAPAKPAPAKK